MGYDLVSIDPKHEPYVYSTNIHIYKKLLSLAKTYGWEAQGTLPVYWLPEAPHLGPFKSSDWSGTYFTNDYQIVTDGDAEALVDALERAIREAPGYICECADLRNKKISIIHPTKCKLIRHGECNNMNRRVLNILCIHTGRLVLASDIDSENPFEDFSDPFKGYLVDFIKFCRNGAFQVW